MVRIHAKKALFVPGIIILGFFGFLALSAQSSDRAYAERLKSADNYAFYAIEAKKEAAFMAKDPAIRLMGIMVAFENKPDRFVYGVYRFSSAVGGNIEVAFDLMRGERVPLPQELKALIEAKTVSEYELNHSELPSLSHGLKAERVGWQAAYMTRDLGGFRAESTFFSDFSEKKSWQAINL